MIKIKIAISIAVISFVGLTVNSAGITISNAQATSDEDKDAQSEESRNVQTSNDNNNELNSEGNNKEQTSNDRDNFQSTSNDGNDILSFNQELLPGLSSSDQKIERYEETPIIANQSGNLQNPSIQNQLNQSLPYSQKDVQLQQSKKPPGAEDCVLDKSGTTANCPTTEALDAWFKMRQAAREAAKVSPDNKAINLGQPWDMCKQSDTECSKDFADFKGLFEDMVNGFK